MWCCLRDDEGITINQMSALVRRVHFGQRKDRVVRPGGGLGGVGIKEAGDERTLIEHVALRRAGEESLAAVAKCCRDHVLLAAVDVAVSRTQDLTPGRPGLLDLRRGPLLLALPPVVIDRCSGLAQANLLLPVG